MDSKRSKEVSGILNSGSLVAIGFLISGVLSIATRIVLARFLEPSGYGLISEGLAVLNILTVISILGTGAGVSRFMSRNEDHRNLVESALTVVLPISFILSGIALLNLEFIASFFNQSNITPVLEALILNVPAAAALSILIGGFRGHEETLQKVIISMIILPGLILIMSLSLILISETAAMAAYGYTLAGWTSAFIAGIWYYARFGIVKPSLQEIKPLLRFSLPLGFKSVLNYGVQWSSIILIGYMLGSSSTGLFNAAYPISYGLLAGLSSINYLFMPVISRMHSNSDLASVKNIYSNITRWLLIGTLPLGIFMALKSETIMTLLFGKSYSVAGMLLSVLVVGQFVKVIFGPLGNILIAVGNTKQEAVAKLCSLIVLILSSIPLISSIGILGAPMGFVLASITGEVVRLYFSRRHASFNPFNSFDPKIIIGGIIGSIFLIPKGSLIINIFQASGFFIFYLIFILGTGVITESDIELVESFLKDSIFPEKIWHIPLDISKRISNF